MPAADHHAADPVALIAALTAPERLAAHQLALAGELAGLADRQMIAHVRRMDRLASRALAEGFAALAADDRAGADALLSDLLALALWAGGGDLPLRRLGRIEVGADLPRGLLGADDSADGLAVWVLGGGRIATARLREAGSLAERAKGGGC